VDDTALDGPPIRPTVASHLTERRSGENVAGHSGHRIVWTALTNPRIDMGECSEYFEDFPDENPANHPYTSPKNTGNSPPRPVGSLGDLHDLAEARLVERRLKELAIQARLNTASTAERHPVNCTPVRDSESADE
jgi:hypothetical protein